MAAQQCQKYHCKSLNDTNNNHILMKITMYCIHNIFVIRVHHFCYYCIIRKNITVDHMTSALQCIVCMLYKRSYKCDL